jgi:hypothetical protein
MKKLKIFIGLMLWINLVSGQYFNNTYDYNNTLDWARTVLSHDNHIYVGSGFSDFQLGGAEGLLFSKIDYSGQVIWSKSLIFADSSLSNGYSGSLQLHGQGFVQVGTTFGIGSPYSVLLIKRDLNGDTIFTRRYQHGAGSIGRSAHVLADQSIILFSESIATANAQANLTIWKLDSLGNVLWVQAYPNGGVDFCVGGTVDEDGNIYISGGNGYFPTTKGLVIKVNSNGGLVWKKHYNQCVGVFINFFLDHLWFSSGVYNGGTSFNTTEYLAKVDLHGTVVWEKEYPVLDNTGNASSPILVGEKIYLSGTKYSGIGQGWLALTDTLGQIQFNRLYQAPNGTDHYINDATPTADGGFALVGWTSNPGQNAWVVKVDSLGCLVPNCALSEEELPATTAIQIWPNPTTGMLYLRLPENSSPAELSLTDITGRIVHHEWLPANGTELVIEMNHLPPGMYFMQVRTATGVLFTGKIVRQ